MQGFAVARVFEPGKVWQAEGCVSPQADDFKPGLTRQMLREMADPAGEILINEENAMRRGRAARQGRAMPACLLPCTNQGLHSFCLHIHEPPRIFASLSGQRQQRGRLERPARKVAALAIPLRMERPEGVQTQPIGRAEGMSRARYPGARSVSGGLCEDARPCPPGVACTGLPLQST